MQRIFTYKRRKVFYWLLLPFAFVLLLYAALPLLVSTNWLRGTLERKLSDSIGRKVSIGAPVSLRVFPLPAVTLRDVSVANISGLTRDKMLSVGALSVSAPLWKNLRGDYHIYQVQISDVSIQIATNQEGASNTTFSKGSKKKEQDMSSGPIRLPTIDDITLRNTKLTLGDGDDSRDFFFKKLKAGHLFGDKEHTLVSSVSISDSPFSVTGTSSPVQVFINDGGLDFNVRIEKDALDIHASGKLQHDGTLSTHLEATGESFSDLNRVLKTSIPDWKDYTFKSDIAYQGGESPSLQFKNTSIAIEDSNLTGDIELVLSPLHIKASLESKKLDLPRLLRANQESENDTESEETEPRMPHDLFKAFDADIDLSVQEFTTFLGIELDRAEISAHAKDGVLRLPKFNADALGGSFTSQMTLGEGDFEVALDGKGFKVNPIMELSGGESLIDGDFNIVFDFKSSGSYLSEIVKGLNGTLEVNSENGKITSSTIRSTSGSLLQIVDPIFRKKKAEEVECMLFRFNVKDGVARSREHVLKLGEVFFFAEGKLDFPEKKVKYNFHVNSQNPSLTSLIPPFRMVGAMSSPTFTPSVSGTVASAADTTEGIARAAFGALGRTANFILGAETEELKGRKQCQKAYEVEQDLISSRIGNIVDDE